MSEINSQAYWDYRFSSDWEKCQGREQSRFFIELTIQAFPEWFVKEVRFHRLSICDWGCALGDGTEVLSDFFQGSDITGVDFSSIAIQLASKEYGKIRFLYEDWLKRELETNITCYDVVFSSNTLEHFNDPSIPMDVLFRHANLFVVLTLPFREINRIAEHHYTFLTNNIKVNPFKNFLLVHSKIINSAILQPNYWPGEQIVLIYARPDWLQANSLTLSELNIDSEQTIFLKEKLEDSKQEIENIIQTLAEHEVKIVDFKDKLANRDTRISSLIHVIAEKDGEIASLNDTVAERDMQIVNLNHAITERDGQIANFNRAIAERDGQIANFNRAIAKRDGQIANFNHAIAERDGQITLLQRQIQDIFESTSWRITVPLRAVSRIMRDKLSSSGEVTANQHALTSTTSEPTDGLPYWVRHGHYYLQRFNRGVRRYGFLRSIPRSVRALYMLSSAWLKKVVRHRQYEQRMVELAAMIKSHRGFIDLFHVPMGWNTPLFQRFQHISQQAARLGALALYGGHHQVDRDLLVFERVQGNVVVFDALDDRVVKCIFDKLRGTFQKKILRLQSIDLVTRIEDIEQFLADGITVVYEYIDEISEEITGTIPNFVKERHKALLQDERILVVATSDKLFNEVKQQRARNYLLSTNGVDLEHWRKTPRKPPVDMEPALQSGRTVVGYHGALAKWIDYELLHMIVDNGKYELVLIGYEHDSSFEKSGLIQQPRVHFLGSKPYFELNQYTAFYDVGILPFKRNALTESVSPVKIFEYMAANKPVITTDLPECTKYKSCLVAKSHEEFLEKLRIATVLKQDETYLIALAEDAERNSWAQKVAEVLHLAGVQIK